MDQLPRCDCLFFSARFKFRSNFACTVAAYLCKLTLRGSREEVGHILGYAGMALTIVYLLSPMPKSLQILRKRLAGQFSDSPYVVPDANCLLWSYFCAIAMHIADQHLWPNLIVNMTSVLIEACYAI